MRATSNSCGRTVGTIVDSEGNVVATYTDADPFRLGDLVQWKPDGRFWDHSVTVGVVVSDVVYELNEDNLPRREVQWSDGSVGLAYSSCLRLLKEE